MIFSRTLQLLKGHIDSTERIVIYGANGWLGKTATHIFHELKIPILLIGRKKQDTKINERTYLIEEFNLNNIIKFKPTLFIDAAFLTRNYVDIYGLDKFIQINKEITKKSNLICEIDSVSRIIQFSSGASLDVNELTKEIQKDKPYEYLKKQIEIENPIKFQELGKAFSIIRLWSMAGCFVKNPKSYLFSDLISQSFNKKIIVNSDKRVFRRYLLAEEVLAHGIIEAKSENTIMDSGGILVEIEDLVGALKKVASNPVEVIRRIQSVNTFDDHYYSDNRDWENFIVNNSYSPASLIEQTELVFRYLKNLN